MKLGSEKCRKRLKSLVYLLSVILILGMLSLLVWAVITEYMILVVILGAVFLLSAVIHAMVYVIPYVLLEDEVAWRFGAVFLFLIIIAVSKLVAVKNSTWRPGPMPQSSYDPMSSLIFIILTMMYGAVSLGLGGKKLIDKLFA